MTTYRSLVPGGYFSADPKDKRLPVTVRTNNPGALNTAEWLTKEQGYVTAFETTTGNRTAVFEAPEFGISAWLKLMVKYRSAGAKTVKGIVDRYGGGNQDYSDYADFVTDQTGLGPAAEIALIDNDILLRFAKAMFKYEAGRPIPWSDEQIKFGFQLALGKVTAPPPPKTSGWLGKLVGSLFGNKTPAAQPSEPVWMSGARKDIGFHEVGNNRGIERFITSAKCGSLGDPYCAIWINAKLEDAGVRGTRSPAARSFENNANFVRLSLPAVGAVSTMWRGSPSSGTGHVFFYLGENDKGILGIGANESDGVRKSYHERSRMTGYWWPKSIPLPKQGRVIVTDTGDTTALSEL